MRLGSYLRSEAEAHLVFSSSLGLISVSIELRHKSASFGAIPMGIEPDFNIFEAILCLKDRQPCSFKFVRVF
jgi:hypothetical protein